MDDTLYRNTKPTVNMTRCNSLRNKKALMATVLASIEINRLWTSRCPWTTFGSLWSVDHLKLLASICSGSLLKCWPHLVVGIYL